MSPFAPYTSPPEALGLRAYFLDTGRYRTYVEEADHAPSPGALPLLFVHGWTMNGRFFRRQLADARLARRKVVVDLRGHGLAEAPPGGYAVPVLADDIAATMDRLGLHQSIVIGWSMGALVALELALAAPQRVAGLVLVDEAPYELRTADWPYGSTSLPELSGALEAIQADRAGAAEAFVPTLFGSGRTAEELAWVVRETGRTPAAVAGALLADFVLRDYRPRLASVGAPTLVAYGELSAMGTGAAARYLGAHLPDARLASFPASGHSPFWEEPDRFNGAVEAFARSLAPS